MAIKKINDLEIEEGAERHAKKSKIKLSFQALLLALLAAGALGLTGGKFLGMNSLISSDGKVKIVYSRIGRIEVNQELEVTLKPHLNETEINIWFDGNYLRDMYVKQILPTPVKSRVIQNKIVYTFTTLPSQTPITISFMFEPQVRGLITARFGIINHENVILQQFIYP